jgi:glycosyltransferase involved in cell wall biosynthesis
VKQNWGEIMTPIRLLHVLGAMDPGGIENWLIDILRRTDRNRYQMDFCCLSGRPGVYFKEVNELGSKIHFYKLNLNLPRFNSWFGSLLESQKYLVVHSHVHKFSGYILWRADKEGIQHRISHSFTAVPRMAVLPRRFIYEFGMKLLLNRHATLGLGNSVMSMESLYGKDWQANSRYQLLYCGIDTKDFVESIDRASTLARYGIPADAIVIGHVGRLTEAKNHKFMLEIARAANSRMKDVWILFVGDGELKADLQTRVINSHLNHVVISGRISRREVIACLQAMDLFIFPSLREGLPQAVIEAQAAGLPCLCSERITPEVVVLPEAVKFMAIEQGPDKWLETGLSILKGFRRDRVNAIRRVETSKFDIDKSAAGLFQIYDSLLAQSASGLILR